MDGKRAVAKPADRRRRKRSLLERQGGTCAICRRFGTALTTDHIIPLSRGGSNALPNLRLLCPDCHMGHHRRRGDLANNPDVPIPPELRHAR